MVDCVAVTSYTHLFSNRHGLRTNFCVPRRFIMSSLQRECKLFGNNHLLGHHLSLKVHSVPESSNKNFIKCYCFGAIMNPESITPASLASYVDETLFVVSVILAYMAGVIPQKRDTAGSRRKNAEQTFEDSSSIPNESKSSDYWSKVNEKLSDASSVRDDCTSVGKNVESEIQSKTYPLSLVSLIEGPRLRLLSAALHHLQKKVSDICASNENINLEAWVMTASEAVVESVHSACSDWLQKEAKLNDRNHDMKVINIITEKLRKDDSVFNNINRSGKLELYADLLFFLRFGCLRTTICYDSKLFTQNGVSILEDLVILLADNIAWIYIELLSVDGNMFTEMNSMSLDLCSLSTRELQRLRNEVVLKQWLVQNFESVVSIYEDRFELSILHRQKQEDPLDLRREKYVWWRKLGCTESKPPSLNYVFIRPISLSVKRTKELRALTGWRYYFSLCLELSDITLPLVKTIFTKITNAISFFLVFMVGRSLGLIFTGIKQSLGWRHDRAAVATTFNDATGSDGAGDDDASDDGAGGVLGGGS